jgi:hypothetical protein
MQSKILILKSSSLPVNVYVLLSTSNLDEVWFNIFGVEVKDGDKVVPLHALELIGGGGIAPFIVILGIRWRWVVSLSPRPLRCLFIGWPQIEFGLFFFLEEEENILAMHGFEPQTLQPSASSL